MFKGQSQTKSENPNSRIPWVLVQKFDNLTIVKAQIVQKLPKKGKNRNIIFGVFHTKFLKNVHDDLNVVSCFYLAVQIFCMLHCNTFAASFAH